jgi:hypothetical protein
VQTPIKLNDGPIQHGIFQHVDDQLRAFVRVPQTTRGTRKGNPSSSSLKQPRGLWIGICHGYNKYNSKCIWVSSRANQQRSHWLKGFCQQTVWYCHLPPTMVMTRVPRQAKSRAMVKVIPTIASLLANPQWGRPSESQPSLPGRLRGSHRVAARRRTVVDTRVVEPPQAYHHHYCTTVARGR